MILVTGGTGNVGSHLLPMLVERGAVVRGLAHSQRSHDAIRATGAEAVDGSLDEPSTLANAMAGCEALFLLSPVHPDLARREKAALDAARRTGVRRVVLLSVAGAHHESPIGFMRWHAEGEQHALDSDLTVTVLRPASYMQVHLLPVQTVAAQGTWYGMSGDGAHAFVDARDVAAVAAEELMGNETASRVIEVTGPAALTLPRAAATLGRVLGRDVAYVDLPRDAFRDNLVGAGLPTWLVDDIVAMYAWHRAGHAATVTDHVERITGRPARSYEAFARVHAPAFA